MRLQGGNATWKESGNEKGGSGGLTGRSQTEGHTRYPDQQSNQPTGTIESHIEEQSCKQDGYYLTSRAFTVFLPIKSVGIMGDGRTCDYVVALRAVQTSDFMTADWAEYLNENQ